MAVVLCRFRPIDVMVHYAHRQNAWYVDLFIAPYRFRSLIAVSEEFLPIVSSIDLSSINCCLHSRRFFVPSIISWDDNSGDNNKKKLSIVWQNFNRNRHGMKFPFTFALLLLHLNNCYYCGVTFDMIFFFFKFIEAIPFCLHDVEIQKQKIILNACVCNTHAMSGGYDGCCHRKLCCRNGFRFDGTEWDGWGELI